PTAPQCNLRQSRNPPNPPATTPPASASRTATTIAPAVTDADIGTATVWVAVGEKLCGPPPPPACTTRWAVELAIVAVSFGATEVMIAAPAKPGATPAAPPTMPMTTAPGLPEHRGREPAGPPPERLERPDPPHPPGHRRHRQQARHGERRDQHQDRQPPAELVGKLGRAGHRPGDLARQACGGGNR